MKSSILAFMTLLFITETAAQAPYQLGSKVEIFSLNDISARQISLKEYADRKAVVVVFSNNTCPYAKLYEARLLNLAKAFAGRGVQFLFINPSVDQAEGGESLQEMAQRASEGAYPFPYLADEGQKISSRFGASRTPEAFVLQNVNGEFVLKYKGAIDDNPQAEKFVRDPYLKNVLEAILKNQAINTGERRATGCMIRRS
jgi:peroxiredoxin